MVCAETQRFCGLCRGSRGFGELEDISHCWVGVGRELVRVGEVAGQQQHEGASEPLTALVEESSLVVSG